jgi:hypothetical protein
MDSRKQSATGSAQDASSQLKQQAEVQETTGPSPIEMRAKASTTSVVATSRLM